MSATAHQQLSDALLARFQAAPALASGRVYANRLAPLPQGRASAVVLRRGQSASHEIMLGGALDWRSVFAVECYARGPVGEDPARAVDALLAQVWDRVFSLAPATLPGLGVMDVSTRAGVEWQFDEAETPMACAIVHFSVQHRTRAATLEPWS